MNSKYAPLKDGTVLELFTWRTWLLVGLLLLLLPIFFIAFILLLAWGAYSSVVDEVSAKTEDTPEPQRSMIINEIFNGPSDSSTYRFWGR